MDSGRIGRAFADQADWCERLGSPFTAGLMRILPRVLDRSTATGRRVLGWEGRADAAGDAVPLRIAGALHALARSGTAPALAALYPPAAGLATDALAEAVRAALTEHDAILVPWLDRAPQTNEVARSGVLYPGLMEIARRTGLPLVLHEIGSSAGLNLMPDRYRYRFGGRSCGDAASPLLLAPSWSGPDPVGDEPAILGRQGCDLEPMDVRLATDRERLVAYVWADQTERLHRLAVALSLASDRPPTIDACDAADFVERELAVEREGVVRVLMHSITFQYLPEASRRRIADTMARLGAAASRRAPLAWLSFEPQDGGPDLRLRLWPDGTDICLARADAHGRAVHWLAGSAG